MGSKLAMKNERIEAIEFDFPSTYQSFSQIEDKLRSSTFSKELKISIIRTLRNSAILRIKVGDSGEVLHCFCILFLQVVEYSSCQNLGRMSLL